jgi:hypothetical protein
MVANALVMSVVSSRNVNLDAIAESINQGSVTSYATQGLVNNITGNGRKSRDGDHQYFTYLHELRPCLC